MRKFLSAFLGGKNSLSGASIILIITLFFSNILGVVRDHYLTQKIPTDLLSVYYAAFRIPDLIFNVLILGAISAAFIPVFSALVTKREEPEAWQVANLVINIAIVLLIISCLILGILMPYIVPHFVPGFDLAHQQLTTKLARIMLASPVFFGLSYIFGAILNSYKRFAVYSLSPLVYNFSIILGAILFGDRYGITGVAYAVVVGAFLHMAIQIPVAFNLGFRPQAILNFSNRHVRRIGLLMVPRALGLGANQILLMVFTILASTLGGYAVATYNLADNIQTMPMVVFGTSFAMAIFPTLAETVAAGDKEKFSYYFAKSFRSILFFILPISAGVFLLREQIVRLILGSGHFGWDQTLQTSNALGYFAIALIFTSLIPLLARSFYALHNTKIPMYTTAVTVAISIAAAYLLTPELKVGGLAIAYSIGSFVNAAILYLILRTKIRFGERELVIFSLKVIFASAVMAIGLYEAITLSAFHLNLSRAIGVLLQLLIGMGVSLIIYLLLAWILRFEEMNSISIVISRITGRSIAENTSEPGR